MERCAARIQGERHPAFGASGSPADSPSAAHRKRAHSWVIGALSPFKGFLALLELLGGGEIQPIVAERLPLTDVRRAHELLESSAATGKLVLVP